LVAHAVFLPNFTATAVPPDAARDRPRKQAVFFASEPVSQPPIAPTGFRDFQIKPATVKVFAVGIEHAELAICEWHFGTALGGRINNVFPRYAPNCAPIYPRITTNALNVIKQKTRSLRGEMRV
jgi:hypothetical protein